MIEVSSSHHYSRVSPPQTVTSAPTTGTWEAPGVAEGYSRFTETAPYQAANRRLIDVLASVDISVEGHIALDLGSGTGAGTSFIADAVGSTGLVIGIDSSAAMVRFATKQHEFRRANVTFLQCDAHDLSALPKIQPGSVFSLNSTTLFPDRPGLFKKIYDLLPMGGIVAINNTLIQDSVDPTNAGALREFIKSVVRSARDLGRARDKTKVREGYPSSKELEAQLRSIGFVIKASCLETFELSNEDMMRYAEVPGTLLELLSAEVPQQDRLNIFRTALESVPKNATFPRRWCFLVGQKS